MPASSMVRVGLISTVSFLLGLSVIHVHSQVDKLSTSLYFKSVAGDERKYSIRVYVYDSTFRVSKPKMNIRAQLKTFK